MKEPESWDENPEEYEVCPECDGDGYVYRDVELANGREVEKEYKCKTCS